MKGSEVMKLMIMPKNKEEVISTIKVTDAFILGLKDLSINMPNYFDLTELKDLIKLIHDNHKEVFISLNKNMHNSDLSYLKETMLLLEELDIQGIMYYDIAVVNLKLDNKLKTPLVWSQEHMTTNYVTSNYWFSYGALYTLLSGEITLEEVAEIKTNAQAKLILPIFGYLPMFVSKRHLIKNYLTSFNLKDKSEINYISKAGINYPIIDNELGTITYSGHILNGIREVPNLTVDYILLNSFNIPSDIFTKVVKMYSSVNKDVALELETKIDSMLDTDRGFLYKETTYKVKK